MEDVLTVTVRNQVDESSQKAAFDEKPSRPVGKNRRHPQVAAQDATPDEKNAGDIDGFPKFDDMSRVRVSLILLSLALASFLFAIEETIVSTSIAGIGAALNAQSSLTWISTSYLLTATAFQPITGRLADAIGTRRFLIVLLWLFIIGNIIAGVAQNFAQLVAGRLVSGVGGAGLLSVSIILISQLTHEKQRGSYLNFVNFVFMIADATGPIVGGALMQSGHWRWIFLINAPFGPIITIILLLVLRLPPSSAYTPRIKDALSKMDLIGMTMLVATMTFLIIGLNSGGQVVPWNSPMIIGMFSASVVAFIAFIIAEKYAELPVAPLNLFVQWKWRNVPLMLVARCLLFFHLFAMTFYLPLFLQVSGVSEINSGAHVIPFLSMAALSSAAVGHATSKYGYIIHAYIAGLIILPVGLGLMTTLDETSSPGRIIGYSLICGLGFGPGTQISVVISQAGLPEDVLPTVTALINTSASLGGVLGVGVVGSIVNNAFRKKLYTLPSFSDANLNDVVKLVQDAPDLITRDVIVKAYVWAWKVGYWSLAGIAVLQLVMSVFLRPVDLENGGGRRKGRSENWMAD